MRDYYIALDVGGSSIKSAIVDELGNRVTTININKALAKEERDVILENLFNIVSFHLMEGESLGFNINGVGIAFPGPFNYEEGISLIKGIDKYESIYEVNLKKALENKFDGLSFKFKNDAHLYALGECNFRTGQNFNKSLCICLGTGVGSAFVYNKDLLEEGENIPEYGWIYNTPFKESIADDYLSTRGLINIAQGLGLKVVNGEEIYKLAINKDPLALEVFKRFGEDLKELMEIYLNKCDLDSIIIGGNISKSYEFFKEPLEKLCMEKSISIRLSSDSTESTLIAVPKLFKNKV